MRKITLILAILLLASCGSVGPILRTVRDVAHTLCMITASERDEVSRGTMDDDEWCVAHAKEYLEEVTRAKQAASRRAGAAK
jgi:uncharacterized protein YceK